MAEGRDTMIGMGVSAPALGASSLRSSPPRAGVAERNRAPDPEVVAKPTRRQFTAAYKLRILEETDGCSEPGEVGPIVRREGLPHGLAQGQTRGLSGKRGISWGGSGGQGGGRPFGSGATARGCMCVRVMGGTRPLTLTR